MAVTSLEKLMKAHEDQAFKVVKKQLNCQHWQVNLNDVYWIYIDPQIDKQLGRSKRVFHALMKRNNAPLSKSQVSE
jgi:hypothetical protein